MIDGCIPPLWEVRPQDFPLCGEVLDLATGVIVHSRYVEERAARARLRRPAVARADGRVAGAACRSRRASRARRSSARSGT